MAKDILITPADGDIVFDNSSGAECGAITQDGNDLVISNAVGDILIGDGASDVYIGDGTNNVDILFEQSGAIKAENGSSGVTLTIGSGDTTLALGSPISSTTTVLGDLTVGVDDTGHDVTFFGATSGKKMLWDQSADTLVVDGTLDVNGDASILSGGGSGSLTVGRNANENMVIFVDDSNTTITGVQDADTNAPHSFILNRTFLGSGANNFIIQKNGTGQLTIDTSANATFAGEIKMALSATTQRALSSTGTDSIQIGDAGVNDIRFKNAAGSVARILANGNVGIGTTTPSAKLHVDGDAIITGTLTAQEFHTEFTSASIMFSSGSTKFGDTFDDTHQFTGSLKITGSNITTGQGLIHINQGNPSSGTNRPIVVENSSNQDLFQIAADTNGHTSVLLFNNGTERVNMGTYWPTYINNGSYASRGGLVIGNNNSTSNYWGVHINQGGNSGSLNVEDALIVSASKVGIGTTSPQTLLHLESTEPVIRYDDTNSGLHYIVGQVGDKFVFDTNNSTYGEYTFDAPLTVTDRITATNVTASGNISASGQVKAQSFEFDYQQSVTGVNSAGNLIVYLRTDSGQFGAVNGSSNIARALQTGNTNGWQIGSTNAGVTGKQSTDTVIITANGNDVLTVTNAAVTASGDISASGNIYAGAFTFSERFRTTVAGTEGFAAIYLNSDSNTGLFQPAADTLGFTTAGSEALRITSAGNVGIGTTSPGVKLDVDGQIRSDDSFLLQSGTTAIGSIRNQGGALDIRGDSTRDVSLGSVTSPQALFVEGTNGNVGIGTTTPTEALQVTGNISASGTGSFSRLQVGTEALGTYVINAGSGYSKIGGVDIGSGTIFPTSIRTTTIYDKVNTTYSSIFFAGADRTITFMTSGSNRMKIDSDGNVGIGTTSPTSKLYVKQSDYAASSTPTADDTLTIERNGSNYLNIIANGANYYSGILFSDNVRGIGQILYNHYGNYMRFVTNGTEQMRITTDGNVGIGTTAPGEKLTVEGNISASGNFVANQITASGDIQTNVVRGYSYPTYNILSLEDDNLPNQNGVSLHSVGSMAYYIDVNNNSSNDSFDWLADDNSAGSATNLMRLTDEGNLGIGTTSPSEKLHVAGNITLGNNKSITFRDSSGNAGTSIAYTSNGLFKMSQANAGELRFNAGFGDSSNNKITFYTRGTLERMIITNDGNVGIGTTSPSSNLHIYGNSTPTLTIEALDTSSPAMTANIVLKGYDGRGKGIFYKESGSLASKQWYSGVPYGVSGNAYVIGYDNTGNNRPHYVTSASLYVKNDGNVGIGTNSPTEALTVTGNISSSGNVITSKVGLPELQYIDFNTDGIDINVDDGSAIRINKDSGAVTVGSNMSFPSNQMFTVGGAISASGTITANDISIADKITHVGDTNTWIGFDDGNDTFRAVVAGSEKFNINTSRTRISNNNLEVNGDVTVAGTITAQEFHTEFVSASILFESGSTKFGDTLDDVHNMTGSLNVTGSAIIDGDVGIGTTSPSAKLEVSADGTTTQEIAHFGNSNGVGKIKLQLEGVGSSKQVMLDSDNNEDIVLNTQGDSHFNISHGSVGIGTTSPAEKLTVEGNISASGTGSFSDGRFTGKVGIGTTSPQHELHVEGVARVRGELMVGDSGATNSPSATLHIKDSGTNAKLRIEDADNLNTYFDFLVDEGNGLYINEASDTRLSIKEGGNVGIGTSSPTEKLQVTGNISASGTGSFSDGRFTGKVGVGTDEPNKILTVGGKIGGASGQNGSFNVRASNNSDWFKVESGVVHFNAAGGTTRAGGIDLGARFNIQGVNDSTDHFAIRGRAPNSASLMKVSSNSVTTGDIFHITGLGKVGIGTSSPTEKLQVTGNISASGTISGHSLTLRGTAITPTADEINYIDGVTSAIQTQLDAKYSSEGGELAGDLILGGGVTLDARNGALATSQAQNLAIVQGVGADTDIGAHNLRAATFTSDVATGTAPLTVTSTTTVANLKAATVATIAGLAPNTATTQATQGAITSVGTLTNINTSGHITASGNISSSGNIIATGTIRGKQLQTYHANFKDNAGTTEHFIPLAGVPDEHTTAVKEQTAIIMPCSGTIKEIILRMHWTSTITTSDDITWKIYNRESNERMNGQTELSTFTMTNPTQGADDANNTRSSGELTQTYSAGDAIMISMQWATTGPTNTADRMYVTVVVENDWNTVGY